MVINGLIIVLLLVLVLPFAAKKVEENLELFLFVMGIAASIISGIMSKELIIKALEEPIMIASAVFIAGALFFLLRNYFDRFMNKVYQKIPVWLVVFLVVLLLGFLSSIITAIIASIILVEIIFSLPLQRNHKIVVCIVACFSIGMGAALTPIGEPLATIAISKLDQEFFYLFKLLGKFIIPAVFGFALIAAVYCAWALRETDEERLEKEVAATSDDNGEFSIEDEDETSDNLEDIVGEKDTWKGIIIRALKVYLFVMALVFLGEGFHPLIDKYVLALDYRLLYWVNMISAVLDNATLTAAEISKQMSTMQIEAILMGLIVSGGMLIPGNIPNIISASKLRITSTEWAKIGVPIGLVVMGIFYVFLFCLQ
jgi:predicted cation transporter